MTVPPPPTESSLAPVPPELVTQSASQLLRVPSLTSDASKHVVEHLKLIQAVIARQNHSAFVVKGWSVTTTGAILAFAAIHPEARYLSFFGIASSSVCWWLDANFLHFERKFRCLYQAIVDLKPVPLFSMEPGPWVDPDFTSVSKCAVRKAVILVHLPMLLLATLAGLLYFKS